MSPAAPSLRIVYRSTGAENTKPRPGYYSKMLGLASVLRAADQLPFTPEIVFLNDGDIPTDLLDVMHDHGSVTRIDGGSNRSSFRTAVAREAAMCSGRPDDLVWFAEDDYLYNPDAFTTLVSAGRRFDDAGYFSLYGSGAIDPFADGRRPVRRPEKGSAGDPDARPAGAATWFRAYSTTSTFGVRADVLREDAGLLRLLPFTGGAWDEATCLTVQGYRPFRTADLRPDGSSSWSRMVLRGIVRAGVNLGSGRRPSRRRVQIGSDPELILHMETPTGGSRYAPSELTAAVDWEALAIDTMFWAVDRGLAVPLGRDSALR